MIVLGILFFNRILHFDACLPSFFTSTTDNSGIEAGNDSQYENQQQAIEESKKSDDNKETGFGGEKRAALMYTTSEDEGQYYNDLTKSFGRSTTDDQESKFSKTNGRSENFKNS